MKEVSKLRAARKRLIYKLLINYMKDVSKLCVLRVEHSSQGFWPQIT